MTDVMIFVNNKQVYVDSLRSLWSMATAEAQEEMVKRQVINIKTTGQPRTVNVCLSCGYSTTTKSFHKHRKEGQPCTKANSYNTIIPQFEFANLQEV